jgi:hypothetical protein
MAPLAQQVMLSDLERLRAQRDRYALALQSSTDERAIDRHARTIARLDEEILATEQALGALAIEAPPPIDPWGVPVVEHTREIAPEFFDDGAFERQAAATRVKVVGVSVAVVAAVLVAVVWLGSRPTTKAVAPTPAPTASIVVSSPVPPDPDDAPARAP